MIKRIVIFGLILVVIIITIVVIYRYQILQYSVETAIRSALPKYVIIDKIRLDLKEEKITLDGFKILNPPHFSDKYLLSIDSISCAYKMKGKTILDGIEVSEPVFKKPVLYIERLKDSRINVGEMQQVVGSSQPSPEGSGSSQPSKPSYPSKLPGNRKISDIVKLPETFLVKDGRFVFIDRLPRTNPNMITLEDVQADISVTLDDTYAKVLSAASKGTGNMNGNKDEVIKWTVSFNPTTPRLTMSNRFEVSDVDIMPFEPYYDKYSPFIFKSGIFSGTLIFDFDNGNIGSTNEIRLSKLKFYIKQGYENAQFWETTVPELVKYFTSPFGEIVFDFKIKGEMSDPKFYLGPISKQALTNMAIDKISSAIEAAQKSGQEASPTPGEPKSDIEKAKEYINLFKELIKKK